MKCILYIYIYIYVNILNVSGIQIKRWFPLSQCIYIGIDLKLSNGQTKRVMDGLGEEGFKGVNLDSHDVYSIFMFQGFYL